MPCTGSTIDFFLDDEASSMTWNVLRSRAARSISVIGVASNNQFSRRERHVVLLFIPPASSQMPYVSAQLFLFVCPSRCRQGLSNSSLTHLKF